MATQKQKNWIKKELRQLHRVRRSISLFAEEEIIEECLRRVPSKQLGRKEVQRIARAVFAEYERKQDVHIKEWTKEIEGILGARMGRTESIEGYGFEDVVQSCLGDFWNAWKKHRQQFEIRHYRVKIVRNRFSKICGKKLRRSPRPPSIKADVPVKVASGAHSLTEDEILASVPDHGQGACETIDCIDLFERCVRTLGSLGYGRLANVLEFFLKADCNVERAVLLSGLDLDTFREYFSRAKAVLRRYYAGRSTDRESLFGAAGILAAMHGLGDTLEKGLAVLCRTISGIREVLLSPAYAKPILATLVFLGGPTLNSLSPAWNSFPLGAAPSSERGPRAVAITPAQLSPCRNGVPELPSEALGRERDWPREMRCALAR